MRFVTPNKSKYASGGNFKYKDEYEKKWDEEEQKIIDEHPRGKR